MTDTRIELCICCHRPVAPADVAYRIPSAFFPTIWCHACYSGCDPEYKCEVIGEPKFRHPDYVDD